MTREMIMYEEIENEEKRKAAIEKSKESDYEAPRESKKREALGIRRRHNRKSIRRLRPQKMKENKEEEERRKFTKRKSKLVKIHRRRKRHEKPSEEAHPESDNQYFTRENNQSAHRRNEENEEKPLNNLTCCNRKWKKPPPPRKIKYYSINERENEIRNGVIEAYISGPEISENERKSMKTASNGGIERRNENNLLHQSIKLINRRKSTTAKVIWNEEINEKPLIEEIILRRRKKMKKSMATKIIEMKKHARESFGRSPTPR